MASGVRLSPTDTTKAVDTCEVPSGMELFGIQFVGINAENGQKLLLSASLLIVVLSVQWLLRRILRAVYRRKPSEQLRFWTRQGIAIATLVLLVLGLLSIWFDNPTRLATAIGLVTAGLAFALQQVVTALAGYVVILRGELFSVGDRITMGGVRGDVIGLRFTTTQVFEMGQPPAEQGASPTMWVRSRQPTGRIVSVSNARVFDEPIYNYSREFGYIWEEIAIPIPFSADRASRTDSAACGDEADTRHRRRCRAGDETVLLALCDPGPTCRAEGVLSAHRQLAGAHDPLHRAGPWGAGAQGRAEPRHST